MASANEPTRRHPGMFKKGNKGGPGNPFAANVNKYRAIVYECATPDEMRDIVRLLVRKAKQGEEWAIRELMDRTMGKALREVDVHASGGIELRLVPVNTGVPQEGQDELGQRGNGRVADRDGRHLPPAADADDRDIRDATVVRVVRIQEDGDG